MATTSNRSTVITYTGDVTGVETLNAASNPASPGQVQIIALTSGTNTITVPVAVGYTATGCTLVPHAANINALTLKGVTGDTGILIHLTDPTSLAIAPTLASFVINAAS